MHEASLAQGLLNLVLETCDKFEASHAGKKLLVREIVCSAGLLAGCENETLRACFEMLAEGTIAEKAALIINTAPLKCTCGECGHEFELLKRNFTCPSCGSGNVIFKGGSGLILQAINVESEDRKHD